MDKKEIEEELAAMGKFKMGQIIGNKWKIVAKLDEGGFGSVYRVQNIKDNTLAALKVERANLDEINYLKLETAVLKELHASGIRSHVPQLFRSAKRAHYCYIIITLLGENLKKLKDKYFPKGMPLRTWSRIGVQCLFGIKTMHDRGYVHRDIKAQNFVLGYHSTPQYARVVYIIDFGLARAYAYPPATPNGKWIPRKARARLEFRGTWRYASPSMHEEKEQGRKDDMWSWLYMMMDLYCGLPWLETDSKNTIELKKLHMKDEDLMIRMPEETKFIPKHLRELDMYQRPDYMRIHAAFEKIRKKYKVSYEDSYEWESKEAIVFNKRAMVVKTAPIGYTAAEEFFKSDPISIGRGPNAKEEKEINERFMEKTKKPELITIADVISTANPSPDKKTTTSAPGTPPSPATELSREMRNKFGTKDVSRSRSPSIRHDKKTVKDKTTKEKKKRHVPSKNSKRERTSEDSEDFVPSCYMNFDIPLHYLQQHNEQPKDFQKKVVSMDWGHAEPQKHFKDAVSPLKPPPLPQQESSGPNSSDGSRGGTTDRSDRVAKPKPPPGSIIQNTLSDDPTLIKKDSKSVQQKKDDQESSNSNKSVSLAGLPAGYYQAPAKKRGK